MTPREDQEKLINELRQKFKEGHKRVVIVASTGFGKSVVIGSIVRGLSLNKKTVYILAHRKRLIKQLSKTLRVFGVNATWVKGKGHPKYTTALGMIQTISKRAQELPEPDYIIVDEAHHSLSDEYQYLFKMWPNARTIGLTATPERTDNQGLGEIYTAMIEAPPMRWLIDNGYLADYIYIDCSPDATDDLDQIKKDSTPKKKNEDGVKIRTTYIASDPVELYKKYMNGLTGIVFCTDISHAKKTAQEFCDSGITCKAIWGTMAENAQDELIDELETGETKLLASADLIGEGVDIPSINGVIQLRRTDSITIYRQQVGRSLRVKSDKSLAIIIDCVQNSKRHGLPCEPRKWSLEGKSKRTGSVQTKTCTECYRVFHAGEAQEKAADCSNALCPILAGTAAMVTESVQHIADIEMQVIKDPWDWANGIDPLLANGNEYKALCALADTEEKLRMIQRVRRHHPRWVDHQMVAKGLKKTSRSFQKYTKKAKT